jgi:PAS domain S-box-containing protein
LVVHAADGQITFSNAQASKLLGLTEQQMRGKTTIDPAWRFVDLDGNTMTVEDYPVSRVIASKKAVEHQVLGVQVPENVDLVWLDVNAFPEFEDNGALKQVVANFHDITELIQAEQARNRVSRSLRLLSDTNMAIARSEQMQALLEDVCRLICEKGGYLLALVGFARDDAQQSVQVVAQSGLDDIQLSQVRISWNESSEYGKGTTGTAIRSGNAHINRDSDLSPDMTGWHEQSQHFGFRSSIAIPFVKKSGQRGALMVYARQADAFKAEEVELLEELVVNLAHGLDALNDQKRRIEAESATKAKAHFLANMSHEIRTPLNAIAGMAHLIRRDGISPSQAIKLDKLESASQHLLGIITSILDLSKIDAGKLELEEIPLRGENIVSSVVSMLIERAQAKNIELRSDVALLPTNLVGDFTRLQQALTNYVTNAIKFTESGQVTIRASVLEESAESALLRFEVTDTGIGIELATLERLFSDFEQADNSTTRKYGGTGLGLAITRKLALLMGGNAGADSQLGIGSTFWFTARLQKVEDAVEAAISQFGSEQVMEFLRGKYAGLRVLVAEDEPVNAEIIRIMLEDIGSVVDSADDGQDALECASKIAYGLIIMDMQMPRMGGLEATRAIRRLPMYSSTPIIACTANAFQEDRMRCMEAGMTGFITKPTLPDKLYAAIYEALEDRPGA